MVLKTLFWGGMHGHGIDRWIEQQGGGAIKLEEGLLTARFEHLHPLRIH